MCLLRLPEKEKRYQSGPTYWKTNFSLSLRKENLSPQEFVLRVEQRLETAPRNCTAMLSQIREELNMPTDNKQLLRLKRMSKSPHWGGEVHNREEGEIGEKMLGGGRYRWEGIFFKGAWGIWRTLWSPSVSWDSWVSWDETPFSLAALNQESAESTFDTFQVTRLAKHLIQSSWGSHLSLFADPRWHKY